MGSQRLRVTFWVTSEAYLSGFVVKNENFITRGTITDSTFVEIFCHNSVQCSNEVAKLRSVSRIDAFLNETRCKDAEWIQMAHDKVQRRFLWAPQWTFGLHKRMRSARPAKQLYSLTLILHRTNRFSTTLHSSLLFTIVMSCKPSCYAVGLTFLLFGYPGSWFPYQCLTCYCLPSVRTVASYLDSHKFHW
jgi:hypothetical protein